MKHLGINQIKQLLSDGGFRPNKTLGQNFLIQPQICEKIVGHLDLNKKSEVLEIGTGLGSLTVFLANHAKSVLSIDVDKKCLAAAKKVLAENQIDNVNLVEQNALHIPLSMSNYKNVCGNLPYNIATPIVMEVFNNFESLETFLVMVQKEVAMRFVARSSSKSYGAVSVKCAYYSYAKLVGDVGRGSFYPQPNVDSSLVLFKIKQPSYKNKQLLFELVELGFKHRRKMLRVSFKNEPWFQAVESATEFDFSKRPQDLSVEDWIKLAVEVENVIN